MFGLNTRISDIDRLISRKKYRKALALIRRELAEDPRNIRLRQQLADLLVTTGEPREAIQLLYRLVDEFVEEGFIAKAIAVLKKMQRIEPGHSSVEERLANLVRQKAQEPTSPAAPGQETPLPVPPARNSDEGAVLGLSEEAGNIAFVDPSEHSGFRRSQLFEGMSEAAILAIIRGLSLRTYGAGEIVVTEEEPGNSLFLLASGSVRVYVRSAVGRNEPVRILNQGDFFGEISLLSGHPRSATVTCATDCEVLELDRKTLDRIEAQNPQVPEILRERYEARINSPEEVEIRSWIELPI